MNLQVLLFTGAMFASIGIILSIFSLLFRDRQKLRGIWNSYLAEFLVIGAILVPAYFGGIVFAVAIGILGTVSLTEFLSVQDPRPPVALRIIAILSGAAIFVAAYLFDGLWLYAVTSLSALALLTAGVFVSGKKGFFQDVATCVLGLVYVSLLFSHILLIRKMENGFLLIVFLFCVSEMNDAFAFMFGSLFGKKKIFPSISPNKTYVGLVAGIIISFGIGMILNAFVVKLPYSFAISAAVLVIAFGFLGDIVSSKIKRALDVKDFSSRIPRLGGVLDVYDSLIFASPLFFYLAVLILK